MTNWQLIIALATLVFAIFGASWLNQRQTEKLLDELGRRFDAKFDGLRAEMKAEIAGVRAEMKAEIGALSQKVDRLDRQLEAFIKPVLPH
jgi:HAMP domain-containing protein